VSPIKAEETAPPIKEHRYNAVKDNGCARVSGKSALIEKKEKINSIKSPDSIIDKSTIEALAIKLLFEEVFLPE
jgi:hypothetical protein